MITLKATLSTVQSLFTSIGMKIDLDKCNLMHFSTPPPLTASINSSNITITLPKFIQWLGFYFNRKLTFNNHTKIMCARDSNIVSGLSCLGNTIVGMTPQHLHPLFKMFVVPMMTYSCQLWYCPATPRITLMKFLQVVQNKGLLCVTGAFHTTPVESFSLLMFQPPIHITIHKLCDSAAICFSRPPLNSKISLHLPNSFIPPNHPSFSKIPIHIPFKHPDFIKSKMAISFLTSLAASIHPNTEHSDPFHSHNAPYAFTSHSPPFLGRLFFNHTPCSKKDCCSLVSEHNLYFFNSFSILSHLIIFTDGSHRDSGTGYGLVGYLEGRRIFQIVVSFAKDASNHNTKMFALTHAACRIKSIIASNSAIIFIHIFSDASSAIKKIFDGSPHPLQDAPIIFRSCFHEIFSWRPLLKCRISWTPGHGGMVGMKLANSLAKQGSLSSQHPLFSFSHIAQP